jgi:hypothetical protein
LLSTRDQQVVAALSKRFDEIASMVC